MSDESQILIPDSFLDLHRDRSGSRLRTPLAEVRDRYEFCEDLAQQLMPQAQHVHFDLGLNEELVLQQMQVALNDEGSGLVEPEAWWVVRRLAELLEWNADGLGDGPPTP